MSADTMARIFISYRRGDTGGYAGRLCDRLTARFGSDQVFMDIQDIHPGQNFVTSIEDTIATCDCVIVVIGPQWLETVQKRVQSGDDFVRHEVSCRAETSNHGDSGPGGKGEHAGGPRTFRPSSRPEPPNAIEIRDERFEGRRGGAREVSRDRVARRGAPGVGCPSLCPAD